VVVKNMVAKETRSRILARTKKIFIVDDDVRFCWETYQCGW
jgi:hypothetical protein